MAWKGRGGQIPQERDGGSSLAVTQEKNMLEEAKFSSSMFY
jgi:hypothetical protein